MKTRSWLMAVTILLAGTWLRVYDLASIPPGLYHDEAFSGLDALSVLRGAGWPIFFEGNGGREPFFVYLHAVTLLLFGTNTFALRIAAAFVGILTLAVFFALVRALNAGRKHSTELALVGTAGFATFYWHLNFSRVGWRTISLPLFACLAFYFFWRARQSGRWVDVVLAGLALGASLYTYLAARFLPIVIACFWLIEFFVLVRSPRRTLSLRRWLGNAIVTVGAALLVFLPLGLYYVYHPNALYFRIADVTLPSAGGPLQALAGNVGRVAAIFYTSGDLEWRHGIARRPILDWVTGIPFAVGLVAAAWRWRKAESWFAFLWLGIMLLPTVLSRDAPDTQRAIGAAPAVCVFVVWGVDAIVQVLAPRLRLAAAPATLAAAALVLVGSGMITFRDYFVVWANDRHAYDDFQGGLADLAHWIDWQPGDLVLPVELYAEPTVHFATLERFGVARSFSTLGDAERKQIVAEPVTAVLPQGWSSGGLVLLRGDEAIFLNPDPAPTSRLFDASSGELWRDKWGRSVATIVPISGERLAGMTAPGAFKSAAIDFDHRLELAGYTLSDVRLRQGQPLVVTLYWSSLAPIQQETQVFVHVLDAGGDVVAGVEEGVAGGYPFSLLPKSELIPDRHVLPIDKQLTPGKYSLELGLYQPATASRLTVWLKQGSVKDDRVLLANLVVPQTNALPASVEPLDVQFSGAIGLAGYAVTPEKPTLAEPFQLTLIWKSIQPVDRDYTVFAHILDSQGVLVAQADHQPQEGAYPTSTWQPGDLVQDRVTIGIPPNAQGDMTAFVGLYDLASGARLPVTGTGVEIRDNGVFLKIPTARSSN